MAGALERLADAVELGLDRCVDLTLGGANDRAATADAALGLDLAVLDPAELGDQLRRRLAHQLEVVGVHEHGHALAVDEPAQRAANDVDDDRRLGSELAGEHLLGDLQGELDGGLLDRGRDEVTFALDPGSPDGDQSVSTESAAGPVPPR